ncbi:MAG: DUF1236 domain-containing protein [Rhodospirillales bacterium]
MRHVLMAGSVAALMLTAGFAWAQQQGADTKGPSGGQAAQGRQGGGGSGGSSAGQGASKAAGERAGGGGAVRSQQSTQGRSGSEARQGRSPQSAERTGGAKKSTAEKRGTAEKTTAQSRSTERAGRRAADADRKARSTSQRADRKTEGKSAKSAKTDRTPNKGTKAARAKDDARRTGTATKSAQEKAGGTSGAASSRQNRMATSPDTKGDRGARSRNAQGGTVQRVQMSQQQRVNVRDTLLKQKHVNRVNRVNFAINVGTRVPRSLRLALVPAAVVALVPAYRNYRYFYVEDRICIVEPSTYEIVDVIDANDAPSTVAGHSGGGGDTALVLSDADAQAWIGKPVFSRDDREIGVVVEVVRERGGRVTAINADVGNFLGLGERRVRVDAGRFRLERERVVLDVPADATAKLPAVP